MTGIENRKACFTTCICLILDGQQYFFEGKCEGSITNSIAGDNGFGYDPIFIPAGYSKTFAELSPATKAAISHRKKAVAKMTEFLLAKQLNK